MKQFTKNDNGFICANCNKEVAPLGYSSRNHCPYCLHSLHLDINPGDRASDCHGLMEPISLEISGKKGYVLVFKCRKCGFIGKNKVADDDDYDAILKISSKP